jgi:SAM-dependent methyltransferase
MNQAGVATSTLRAVPAPSGGADAVQAYYHEIAPFYDAELTDRDDLDFWRSVANGCVGGRTLEIGAGTGRVTVALAATAGEVVAIDLSPDLLLRARQSLSIYPQVTLIRADMRALPLLGTFDLVVAANDPLSHLLDDADRDRAFCEIVGCLAPGGHFVLDALWLSPDEAAAVNRPGGRVRHHVESLHGEPLGVTERWCPSPGRQPCFRAEYQYRRPGRRTVEAAFDARAWEPSELHDRFDRAGLREVRRWGSYRRDPWDSTSSPNLIVEATRAAT